MASLKIINGTAIKKLVAAVENAERKWKAAEPGRPKRNVVESAVAMYNAFDPATIDASFADAWRNLNAANPIPRGKFSNRANVMRHNLETIGEVLRMKNRAIRAVKAQSEEGKLRAFVAGMWLPETIVDMKERFAAKSVNSVFHAMVQNQSIAKRVEKGRGHVLIPDIVTQIAAAKGVLKTMFQSIDAADFPLNARVSFQSVWYKKEENSIAKHEHYLNARIARLMNNSSGEINGAVAAIIDQVSAETGLVKLPQSGFHVSVVTACTVTTTKYVANVGRGINANASIVAKYMEVPKSLRSERTVCNVKNDDNRCFFWSFLAIKHAADVPRNKTRQSNYAKYLGEVVSELCANNQPMPLDSRAYSKFEDDNACRVFVYVREDGEIGPHFISKKPASSPLPAFHFLLLQDETDFHYVAITDPLSFFFPVEARNGPVANCHVCSYCLFRTECARKWEDHNEVGCSLSGSGTNATRLIMPLPGSADQFVGFSKFDAMLPQPMWVTFDTEALFDTTVEEEFADERRTRRVAKHLCSHAAIQVCIDPRYVNAPIPPSKFGIVAEVVEWNIVKDGPAFLQMAIEYLFELSSRKNRWLSACQNEKGTTIPLTGVEKPSACHFCKGAFVASEPVRHHDRISGQFVGWAHSSCNDAAAMRPSAPLPIFTHNGRSYDWHFVVSKLTEMGIGETAGKIAIDVIPCTNNKYLSFSCAKTISNKDGRAIQVSKLQWIDSCQHVNASLESIVANMTKKSLDDMHYTRRHFQQFAPIMCRKGVFPYEYMDGVSRLSETALPSKDKFFSKLTLSGISDDDYAHAQNVWSTLGCETILDYQSAYIRSDVTLLADVIASYRDYCLSELRIDPCGMITSPSVGWNAMLLQLLETRGGCAANPGAIENITDEQMYRMTSNAIMGGISYASQPFARANNVYSPGYDAKKPNSWLLYEDVNSLYPTAMMRPMPVGDYSWVSDDVVAAWSADAKAIPENCLAEIDVSIRPELHEYFNDYSPLVVVRRVSPSEVSPFTKKLAERLDTPIDDSSAAPPKLIPTLERCEKIVATGYLIRCWINLGLTIERVHRAFTFEQKPFMRPYVEKLQALRRAHKKEGSAWREQLDKLMLNSVYGKTMERVENRTVMKLTSDDERYSKLVSNWKCSAFSVLVPGSGSQNALYGIEIRKTSCVMNRPLLVGATVLNVSKTIMFDAYYGGIKAKYGDNAMLVATDTDSLMVRITTPDIYDDYAADARFRSYFDLTTEVGTIYNRVTGEPRRTFTDPAILAEIAANSNKFGLFKSEVPLCTMSEIIACRSKMYSIKVSTFVPAENKSCAKSKCTAKGVARALISKGVIGYESYREAMADGKSTMASMDLSKLDGRTVEKMKNLGWQDRVPMMNFRAFGHDVFTTESAKIALSSLNDKRYVNIDVNLPLAEQVKRIFSGERVNLCYGHHAIGL